MAETNKDITFEDGSSNNPTSFYWNFGDGTIINETTLNPVTHRYTTPKIYTVTHKANNVCGAGAACTQELIVYDPTCTPNWQTGTWGACQPNNTQSRTVTDSNNCGVDTGKPATVQACTYTPQTHLTCINDICTRVEGAGSDTCTGEGTPCKKSSSAPAAIMAAGIGLLMMLKK